MSASYDERESAAVGSRPRYNYAGDRPSYSYDGNGQAYRRRPADKKKALNRLRELKPLVDRIINECTIESKEVKTGLQAIRDYQTGVLDELRDIVEEEDEPYEIRQSSAEGYLGHGEDVYGLRDQKDQIRSQIEGEVRATTRMAEDYHTLESDYNRLRGEVERLRRKNRFESEAAAPVAKRIIREDLSKTRPSDDVPRSRSRSKQFDDAAGRRPSHQVRRSQSEDIYDENQRLKQELNDAYNTIDNLKATLRDLERQLTRAEDELERVYKTGGQGRNVREKGDVSRQLAELKQQNEQLRVETLRLLKLKSVGGSSQEVTDLQNEIMNLHDSIERQNDTKVKFIQEMNEYKRKFALLEAENRDLKARGAPQYGSSGYESLNVDYQPAGGVIYNEMATVLDYRRDGDDKLNKFRDFLNDIKTTNYRAYG